MLESETVVDVYKEMPGTTMLLLQTEIGLKQKLLYPIITLPSLKARLSSFATSN